MNEYDMYEIHPKNNSDFVYIGSTYDFDVRKSCHKSVCNNPKSRGYNCKVYKFIRENGGWNNFEINIFEECGELTEDEAHIREEYWKKVVNANLNSYRAYRTKEQRAEYHAEYRANNKEIINVKNAEYHQINKEIISVKKAEKVICECGCVITRTGLARHRRTAKHMKFEKNK
jgi:hypothetical protein